MAFWERQMTDTKELEALVAKMIAKGARATVDYGGTRNPFTMVFAAYAAPKEACFSKCTRLSDRPPLLSFMRKRDHFPISSRAKIANAVAE